MSETKNQSLAGNMTEFNFGMDNQQLNLVPNSFYAIENDTFLIGGHMRGYVTEKGQLQQSDSDSFVYRLNTSVNSTCMLFQELNKNEKHGHHYESFTINTADSVQVIKSQTNVNFNLVSTRTVNQTETNETLSCTGDLRFDKIRKICANA